MDTCLPSDDILNSSFLLFLGPITCYLQLFWQSRVAKSLIIEDDNQEVNDNFYHMYKVLYN